VTQVLGIKVVTSLSLLAGILGVLWFVCLAIYLVAVALLSVVKAVVAHR
jgi:hypothetical protein